MTDAQKQNSDHDSAVRRAISEEYLSRLVRIRNEYDRASSALDAQAADLARHYSEKLGQRKIQHIRNNVAGRSRTNETI